MRVGRYMPFNEITPATNFLCVAAFEVNSCNASYRPN